VHTRWAEAAFEAETDAAGIARGTLPALTEPGICSLAAGVVYHHDLVRRRVGDYRHILVGMDR
jgi:hypothetical protein